MAGRSRRSRLRDVPLHRDPLPQSPPRRHPVDDPRLYDRLRASVVVNPATSRSQHSSTTILEDHIAVQHREIQSLLLENQRLAATHVALKQELGLSHDELRHLSAAASDVKAERDSQVREVYERSLGLEAEVRTINAMSGDIVQVRTDVQNLTVDCRELTEELESINGDLTKASKEAQQLPSIKAEIESFQREIQRGRAAIEHEKKTTTSNFEHGKTMEKNMIALSHETERLRAELANAEKRVRAAAAANPNPGYAGSYGTPQIAYGGTNYPDPYMHQVQGDSVVGSPLLSGVMPNYAMRAQANAHR